MAKKLYSSRALELMENCDMLPDDKGVYHAIGDEPIDWYNTGSDICRSCGINKRYPSCTKCVPCARAKRVTQFKLCPNYEDQESGVCDIVIPAGYRLGKDLCAGCAAVSKRATTSDGAGLCCVCQMARTKKKVHDVPVCAKCLQKSGSIVMRRVDAVRSELDESICQFSRKNDPPTEDADE